MEIKTRNRFLVLCALASVLVASITVSAHHGTSVSYDSSKPITLVNQAPCKVSEMIS